MKTQTILILGSLVAGVVFFARRGTLGRDLGDGWRLSADGQTATNSATGASAQYTGYMTADVYPSQGAYL